MTNDRWESKIGVISVLGLCVMVWMIVYRIEQGRIVEHCNEYGSFVYDNVIYTCERMEERK
jgi:hypothetical protein